MARKENSQPVINSMEDYYRYVSTDGSGTICIPDTLWPIIYQYDEPQNLVVRATSTDAVSYTHLDVYKRQKQLRIRSVHSMHSLVLTDHFWYSILIGLEMCYTGTGEILIFFRHLFFRQLESILDQP